MLKKNVAIDIEVMDISQTKHKSISWVYSLDPLGFHQQRLDTINQVLREYEEFKNVKVQLYTEKGKLYSWFHDVESYDPYDSLSVSLSRIVHETLAQNVFPKTLKKYHEIIRRKVLINDEIFSFLPVYSDCNMWNDIGEYDHKLLGIWVVWGEDNPQILPIIARILDTVTLGLDGSAIRPLLGLVVHDELREDAYRRSDDYEWN